MAVISKRANRLQREWLTDFESLSCFEAMYQHDFDAHLLTFEELVKRNIEWIEDTVTTIKHLKWEKQS